AVADFPLSTGRIGLNYMDFATISTALKEGQATIDRPVIGRRLLVPVLRMAAPIRDAKGKIIGALAGAINLTKPSFLDRIPEKLTISPGSYLLLISPPHQMIVAASDKSRIMEVLPKPSNSPGLERFMQGYEGSLVTANLQSREVLASAKRVPVTGWLVVLSLPADEAFAPILTMQRNLLLAALFLSLLAGALIWWMLRRELAPMLMAANTLARQSAGEQQPQLLQVIQQDEIGQLIGGFNRLLETLNQREESLLQSEARLTNILDETKIHLWAFDGSRYTFMNKQWFDFTGQESTADLSINLWTAVVHPDDLAKATEIWREHWAARTEHDNYFRLRRHDGVYRDFYCHARPVLDTQGVFQFFQGFNLDITERKRLEEELDHYRLHLENLVEQRTTALYDAEEKYRTVADFTYDWETWVDPAGHWLYCSPACERVTGYRAEEFMERPELYLNIVHTEDRAKLSLHLDEDERNSTCKNVCDLEYRIHHKNDEVRWINHLCQPVEDASGKSLGRRVSNRDITDRKRAEDLLHQARDQAEAANLAKSTFLSNMSHEIRTPLNGIIGMTHILRRGTVTPVQIDRLDKIDTAAAHLLSLINDILDLSKIEAGKIILEEAPVAINSLLINVKSIMGARAQAKGLQLRVVTEFSPPEVQG
ncbi:MAG: PAS domain-containing protein, partial [Betaproteobacteria bacterium]